MQIKYLPAAFLLIFSTVGFAQNVTLQDCIHAAIAYYPIAAQTDVIDRMTDEYDKKINANWQPQVGIKAQATYQSDVPYLEAESPFFVFPELSKDQYKVDLVVSQLLYDGGNIRQAKSLQALDNTVKKMQVETELYQLKQRVVQVYAAILYAGANLQLIQHVQDNLNERKKELQSSVANGTSMQLALNILESEIITLQQQNTEIENSLDAAIALLSDLTGTTFTRNTLFATPEIEISASDNSINRPELDVFASQTQFTLAQKDFATTINLPQVSLFATAGYGLPGYNFFLNTFDTYYMAGIKLDYPLWQGNTKKSEAALYTLQAESIANQQKTFELNTHIEADQKLLEIEKYNKLIDLDKQLIDLKTSIANTSKVQLENGVITATDYVVQLNALLESQQQMALHETQLLIAKINYTITLGKL